jgi:hypothetical protein
MRFAHSYAERQPMTAEEEAYDYLLGAICSGKLHTGDRLIAEDIANEIGMSRMPVREALRSSRCAVPAMTVCQTQKVLWPYRGQEPGVPLLWLNAF